LVITPSTIEKDTTPRRTQLFISIPGTDPDTTPASGVLVITLPVNIAETTRTPLGGYIIPSESIVEPEAQKLFQVLNTRGSPKFYLVIPAIILPERSYGTTTSDAAMITLKFAIVPDTKLEPVNPIGQPVNPIGQPLNQSQVANWVYSSSYTTDSMHSVDSWHRQELSVETTSLEPVNSESDYRPESAGETASLVPANSESNSNK